MFKVKKTTEKPNSLVLTRDELKLQYISSPPGYPHRCQNENDKEYYLLVQDSAAGAVPKPMVLPDRTEYFSPSIYGSVVLTMEAHSKLFERRQSLIEKLQPILLLAGIIIIGIILIAVE